jgi:hypothetical protein
MWALEKHVYMSLQNSIRLLDFDFMTMDQIINMSMNDLRR